MTRVKTADAEPISYSLYLAAFAATLCGVLTVADGVDDSAFAQKVLVLTVVGVLFSVLVRRLRVNLRLLEWACLLIIVVTVARALTGHFDLAGLIPEEVTRNDQRVAIVLCWGAVLLSFFLLHDVTLLYTPLLAVAEIGLVASFDVNSYVIDYFFALLAVTFFLLTHFHSHTMHLRADVSERLRKSPKRLPYEMILAAACAALVLGVGMCLVVPVDALSKGLSLAGAIRQLALLGAPSNSGFSDIRFSDDSTFNIGTGEGWSASSQVLLKVTPSDGQPHLWRGRTYDHYDGSSWESTITEFGAYARPIFQMPSGAIVDQIRTKSYVGRSRMTARFQVLGDTSNFYYAPTPEALVVPGDINDPAFYGVDGNLTLVDQRDLGNIEYQTESQVTPDPMDTDVQAALRHAGQAYPSEIRRLYLSNMSDGIRPIPPRALAFFRSAVKQALSSLPPGHRAPIDKAVAIRNWVSDRCVYSLNVSAIPAGTDHVYEFLANTRLGYCDLFASSMAVLCRVAGVPARVATGFAPGLQVGRSFDLRAMDKHAWTEVYFPGAGWLDFDPTAGSRSDSTIPGSNAAQTTVWYTMLRHLGAAPIVLCAAIGLLLLYAASSEWLRRRHVPGRAHPTAVGVPTLVLYNYRRLTRSLGRLGLTREESETPSEYAIRVRLFLINHGEGESAADMVSAVIRQFVVARYGPESLSSDFVSSDGMVLLQRVIRRLRRRQITQRLRLPLRRGKVEAWN